MLRCSGMSLRAGQDDKGEWLQVTYYDEDCADVGERYRLHTPAQRRLFALRFLPLHLRAPGMAFTWERAKDIEAAGDKLRAPDFVVARRRGHFWQVREKVFDYQGRLRRAHELRG